MGRNSRRRPTGPRRATFAAMALMLGGGGLIAANVYASATEDSGAQQGSTFSAAGGTIDCPDVGSKLTEVPDKARPDVDKDLAALDQQIAQAYQQLQAATPEQRQDSGYTDDKVMKPLEEQRGQTLDSIGAAMDQAGGKSDGLDAMADCQMRTWNGQDGGQNAGDSQGGGQNNGQNNGSSPSGQPQGGQQNGNGGQAGNGPVAADYQDINSVQPNSPSPDLSSFVSKGTFTTSCGVNANGLRNSDNVIVAPGVSNGAHHFHDYIGNQSNTAFASDDDLAKADTSCENKGDKSTYYWPVLRLQNGTQEQDADKPGGGTEGNAGQIVTPKQVTMTFIGSPRSKVAEMPRLLRIITGDAKAFVNGPANANASWSCTGFEDRQLKDKYPLCPQGSDVVRTFRFQSCWDGRNIDSANHRTHVAFADASGACPNGFEAIPQLVQRIVYDVKAPSLQDGGKTTPLFAVDSFPENLHKPVTDHGDFINVFDAGLMKEMVSCINDGRNCGAGTGEDPGGSGGSGDTGGNGGGDNGGNGGSGDNGGSGGGATESPSAQPTDAPSVTPSQEPTAQPTQDPGKGNDGKGSDGTGNDGKGSGDNGGSGNGGSGGGDQGGSGGGASQPTTAAPQTEQPGGDEPSVSSTSVPKVYGKSSSSKSASAAPANSAPADNGGGTGGSGGDSAQSQASGGNDAAAAGQTEPQAVQGNLAETGTSLWPAAAGTVLLIAGLVVLARSKRTFLRQR
ncbi:DUF1996 domain-containing protein [Streptomyces sp. CdTB01]|uniref:DUF1996 domain-containing protein n=1 Tax=Streptomyces sp. CdTB01 TaxID=1725411 RepID=UPI000AD09EC5|nr:DUF1996 domain-containing protein [Streptomyces sp. CdTB01]